MKVTAVYFSPTGGPQKYVRQIAAELSGEYTEIDLTNRDTRLEEHFFTGDDLVVLGVPVYYGRVPQIEGGLLNRLHGDHTPVVLVLSYGNRAFDDALLELSDLCAKQDFYTAAAFTGIAQHTFSPKIAAGRPHAEDLALARGFAAQLDPLPTSVPILPGTRPYRPYGSVPFAPKGDKSCAGCGVCSKICPAGAIDPSAPRKTDTAKCIRCFACIKQCPTLSRKLSNPLFRAAAKKLEDNLTKTDQQCESFLP